MLSVKGFFPVASPASLLPSCPVCLSSVSDSCPYPSCLCLPLPTSFCRCPSSFRRSLRLRRRVPRAGKGIGTLHHLARRIRGREGAGHPWRRQPSPMSKGGYQRRSRLAHSQAPRTSDSFSSEIATSFDPPLIMPKFGAMSSAMCLPVGSRREFRSGITGRLRGANILGGAGSAAAWPVPELP